MTDIVLMDDFAQEALNTGRELLHSTDQIAELRLTRGCFVARAGAELPEGAAPLWHFKIEGVDLTLFTVI